MPCRRRFSAALAFLAAFAFASTAAGAERFAFRITIGRAAVSPFDLNSFLADYARSILDFGVMGYKGGGMEGIKRSDDFEIAFDLPWRGRLGIFLSAGLVGASRSDSRLSVADVGGEGEYLREDRIRSVVVRAGLTYNLPLARSIRLRPRISLDGYWSTFKDNGSQAFTHIDPLWNDSKYSWTAGATALNIGGTAGVGFEADIIRPLSFCLEAGFRWARLSGFKGDVEESHSGSADGTRDFILLYFETHDNMRDSIFRQLNLPGNWLGEKLTLVRSGVLNLSGPFLKAGVRVAF